MNKNIALVVVAVVVLTVVILALLGMRTRIKPDTTPGVAENAQVQGSVPPPVTQNSLGAQVYDAISNPASKLPEANPFKAETNPYSAVKTNPFAN